MNQKSRLLKKILLALVLVYAVPAVGLAAYKFLRPKTISSGTIHYALAWDTSGVRRDGKVWVFQTNLGYTVKLEQGFINAYGVQLMACPHSHSWLESLLAGLEQASGVALAGHSQGQDPAALQENTIQNLLEPQSVRFKAVTVHEPNYCKGYFVATRATPNSKNLNAVMAGKSIFLQGTYSKNGITKPFNISSQNAFGDTHKLFNSSVEVHVGISSEPIRITFIQRLKGLFDNLEFESDSEFTRSMTVLRNFNSQIRVVVLSGKVHPI
jgi:hypothetical protein